jgi:hypothetical protein
MMYNDGIFEIIRVANGFIVRNTLMDGFAHTHIKNYKTCLYLIQLSKEKRVPNDLPRYLKISLKRINEGEFRDKVEEHLQIEKNKQCYFNRSALR